MNLSSRANLAAVSILIIPITLQAQEVRTDVLRSTIMVGGVGSGIIVSSPVKDGSHYYAVTASHVVSGANTELTVKRLLNRYDTVTDTCRVRAAGAPRGTEDMALLRCETSNRNGFVDGKVFADPARLERGEPVTVVGSFGNEAGFYVPYSLMRFTSVRCSRIEFVVPSLLNIMGASGGPLVSRRSDIVGMVLAGGGDPFALPIQDVVAWARKEECDGGRVSPCPISASLAHRGTSAPAIRQEEFELAVGFVPSRTVPFGWTRSGGTVRLLRPLSREGTLSVAGELLFAEGQNQTGRSVNIVNPSVSLQWQLGSQIGFLQGSDWRGGIYLSGGMGLSVLNARRDTGGVAAREFASRSPSAVVEVGWRYRIPAKPWGFWTGYSEIVAFGQDVRGIEPQFPYDRFSSIKFGLFWVGR